MNILNSKTNESNRSMYQFTDKFNLKDPNKNIALANVNIYYTWKNIEVCIQQQHKSLYTTTINLKYLLQLGMMNLLYLMDLTRLNKFKIILITSTKNMKLLQIILLYKFM